MSKVDELKKVLRVMIREEVRKTVQEEVSKAMGKVLVEMVKEIKSTPTPKQQVEEDIPLQEVIHTKNPKLNQVLAETARYAKPIPRDELSGGLAELMDGGFNKIGQNQDAGVISKPSSNLDFVKQMVGSTSMVPQQQSVLDAGAEVPDILKGVFKKDFRATMKKIDEAKKNGMFSSAVSLQG